MTGSESAIPGGALDGKAGATATTVTAAELAAELGCDARTAERLLSVASTLVETYAPAAPPQVLNEAVVRCAGWLLQAPRAGQGRNDIGPMSVTYSPSRYAALRHSGAMSLLSPFKRRRAGLAG